MFNYEQIPVHCSFMIPWMIPQKDLSDGRRADAVILCVDDDDVTLDVIKLTLEKNGFSVLTATNWRRALDTFRKNPIDLVMLDYEMPEMKGHEVAVLIRSIDPTVPIILHSGSPQIPDCAIKMTDAFLQKGVETHILVDAISNLIMNSQLNPIRAQRRA
jgi:CheY-like chemotaxis protein